LLIQPDFITNNQELKEHLSDHKLQKTERLIQKSVKPFIEVISASAASEKSEQNLEQIEEKSHGSQNISDYHQKEVSM
jgi:hypothetical protein